MDDTLEDYLDLVGKRSEVMAALEGEPLDMRDLEERTGASRATVSRAIRSLEEAGLAERVQGDYVLTVTGRLALSHYRSYREGWRDLVDSKAVLGALPSDAPISTDAVVGGDPSIPPEEAPYQPVQEIQAGVEAADDYRAVLPALGDPKVFRLLYEHVVTDGQSAELVVSEKLESSLSEQFPRRLARMADSGAFELLVGEVPPYGLVITESDGDRSITLIAFGDAGGVGGVISNDADAAVRWAEDRYGGVRDDADRVTDALRQTTDGGAVTVGGLDESVSLGPELPLRLDRQGFVMLNREFFVDADVADPATAWRAGLDLAEVHTGYAVERSAGDDRPLSARLGSKLRSGEDCVLVGPPGSGKSTTAKQVACEWYDADRGPVLYRPSGRGATFAAVEDLVATVEAAQGHALVVVEDVVRPEATAAFDAARRLSGRSDVDASFLFDARASEWRDPPGDSPLETVDLTVEGMPRLLEDDYRRLVEGFERTAGVDVDVPAEQIREDVRTASPQGDDETVPGEVLLFTHRLAAYADPLADSRTSLEDDVAATYDAAAEAGDPTLDVATVANVLNAAGVEFGPGVLRAAVDGATSVAEAREPLDGRLLFGVTESGTYRTPHEEWSVAFLERLVAEAGESGARERVRRCLSAVLTLADETALGRRVRGEADTSTVLDRVAATPGEWADEAVRALLALVRDRPTLAPLLGDADGTAFDVPEACESVTDEDRTLALGRAFLRYGDNGRARATFERLAPNGDHGVERALGLARACDDPDRSSDYAREALQRARRTDDRRAAAEGLVRLAAVARDRGDTDEAIERLETALDHYRDVDDRRGQAGCLTDLAVVHKVRGEYDRARDRLRAGLDRYRAVGDRNGESDALAQSAMIARQCGEFERAQECLDRCLALRRSLRRRSDESRALSMLGILAEERGDFERAREYYERSLDVQRDLDDPDGEAEVRLNLGDLLRKLDEPEAAHEHLERSLDLHREIGDRRGEAMALLNLAEVAITRENYDYAHDQAHRARERFAQVEDRRTEAIARVTIGAVARERGDYDAARVEIETALEGLADAGVTGRWIGTVEEMVLTERAADRPDAAREWCDRALSKLEDVTVPGDDLRETFETYRDEIDAGGDSI